MNDSNAPFQPLFADAPSAGVDHDVAAVEFPSAMFPAPPTFHITVPRDWHPAWLPDAAVAARSAMVVGGFAANIVVRSRRVAPRPADPTGFLRSSFIEPIERGDGAVVASDVNADEHHPVARVQLRAAAPNGTPTEVVQIGILTDAHDELSFLTTITGSVASAASEDERDRLRAAVASFRFTT